MTSTVYAADESDLDSVADDLVRLWSENLRSMGAGAPAKLHWYYRTAPTGPGRAIVLRARSERGDAIVGCQGIGFRRMMRGDAALRVALLADLSVDKHHRTHFPALTLVRQARAVAAGASDFQYAFPNRAAVGLFRRLGYHALGDMVRHARVLRFSPYLARRVRVPLLARIGGAALDAADAALQALPRLRAGARFRLAFPSEPDARLDALFDEARRHHGVIGDRGRDFLRWRFFTRAGGAELATLLRRGDGALRAYAVVVRQGDAAQLSDFLGASEPELEALLALLLPALRRRGCSSASVRFLGTARIPRLLVRLRFRRRGADRTIVLAEGREALSPDLTDVESFYLTDADEDE
ncbi:MAG TPA: hypothetical protein VIV57_24355 [Anaeromyxobacter sp.]